eukprot:scaffold49227_cov63-Phaeocystis_antarctica.AAC.1
MATASIMASGARTRARRFGSGLGFGLDLGVDRVPVDLAAGAPVTLERVGVEVLERYLVGVRVVVGAEAQVGAEAEVGVEVGVGSWGWGNPNPG